MKKLLLTSLVAVFAASGAQAADYFVGGSAALSMDNTHSKNFMVAPEVGWIYNEKWDLGVRVGFDYSHNLDVAALNAEIDDVYMYGAGVFARYNVAEFGGVKLLLKGGVDANFVTLSEADHTETAKMLGAYVVPMITYDISDAFTLYAELNFAGLNASYVFENTELGLEDGWSIGAYADSADVANTSDFQIGFLYKF